MRTIALVVFVAITLGFLLVKCLRGNPSGPTPGRLPYLRQVFNFLTGEWLLRGRANGGDVIFFRAVWISIWLYVPFMALKSWAGSGWSFDFDLKALGSVIAETLPWLGAIFAGAYVALYTRFSAQWSYLSGVYNQIMAADAGITKRSDHQETVMNLWRAAFVEDAVSVHLARKKGFAELVWTMLERDAVREVVDDSMTKAKREKLQRDLISLFPTLQAAPPAPPRLAGTKLASWVPR